MFRTPVVLEASALIPVAMLLKPVVLWVSALSPVAVLLDQWCWCRARVTDGDVVDAGAVVVERLGAGRGVLVALVLKLSAEDPVAVLELPVVFDLSAFPRSRC